MLYAVVKDNVVTDVDTFTDEQVQVLARTAQVVIDVSEMLDKPELGWIFDGSKIVAPADFHPTRRITKLGLRRRLTFTELCALEAASATDVRVAALKGNLNVATYVDLNRVDTVAAMGLLQSLTLLTPERAAEILNAPIQDDERYKGNE